MRTFLAVGLAVVLVAVVAVPTFAADPPYKIPPGQYCKGVSKKHIKGEKGTPFSQCVKAMAQINKKPSTSAGTACKALSKKKVAGMKLTPFKTCVKAATKLKKDLAANTP